MRFDWYQATVPENPVLLIETLKAQLAPTGVIEQGRGFHNYYQSLTLKGSDGDRLAVVLCGGPNGDPNVTASGEDTPAFVKCVRDHWPNHRVTRLDSAEDFCADRSWETLENVCRGVTGDHKVKGRAIVPDDVSEGRTYYMGAPSSDVRVRLYEKTAETRSKLPESRWHEVPDGWSRLEIQARPKHPLVKQYASTITPEEVWGFAAWTTELANRAMSLSVERIKARIAKESDDDRAFRFMVTQYAKVLRRRHADLGCWEGVGFDIGQALLKLDL